MELLICVKQDTSGGVHNWTKRPQAGDTIVSVPDGHVWGNMEKSLPQWRILCFPNMTPQEADVFLSPELARTVAEATNPLNTVQYRGMQLDLSAIKDKDFLDYMNDDTRAEHRFVHQGKMGKELSSKQKVRVDDPLTL